MPFWYNLHPQVAFHVTFKRTKNLPLNDTKFCNVLPPPPPPPPPPPAPFSYTQVFPVTHQRLPFIAMRSVKVYTTSVSQLFRNPRRLQPKPQRNVSARPLSTRQPAAAWQPQRQCCFQRTNEDSGALFASARAKKVD